jgi:allantoicase
MTTSEPSATEPQPDWLQLPDLAGERLGGAVLFANDEFFAEKESLLRPHEPIWSEDAYTDRGKWMDGWETRRRRTPGHDWCLVRLGLAGVLRGVVVDTRFFRGNFPESCALEACAASPTATVEELAADDCEWIEVLPQSLLRGDARNLFPLVIPWRFTHLRLRIFPDGGVARLRVHGEVVPDWPALVREAAALGVPVDLAAVAHGGRALDWSDRFYSSPDNLLRPGRGMRMDDGWETKRRRGPGHDWCVLRTGIAGTVQAVEVDTAHFKGNFPESCALAGCTPPPDVAADDWAWRELVPRTPLEADHVHRFAPVVDVGPVTHVRLAIFPDGGVSRLRLYGEPSAEGLRAAGLERLNALTPRAATSALADCCGAPDWVRRMRERRPFETVDELLRTADLVWDDLGREEWLAAFRHHPEIGAARGERAQSAVGAAWSAQEQAGVATTGDDTRAALVAGNAVYRERFGFVFLVCATGRTAEEMLALCRARLGNDPERELLVAAEEQRKITRLRLEKLLGG